MRPADLQVFAFDETELLEAVDDSLAALVSRGLRREVGQADLVNASGLRSGRKRGLFLQLGLFLQRGQFRLLGRDEPVGFFLQVGGDFPAVPEAVQRGFIVEKNHRNVVVDGHLGGIFPVEHVGGDVPDVPADLEEIGAEVEQRAALDRRRHHREDRNTGPTAGCDDLLGGRGDRDIPADPHALSPPGDDRVHRLDDRGAVLGVALDQLDAQFGADFAGQLGLNHRIDLGRVPDEADRLQLGTHALGGSERLLDWLHGARARHVGGMVQVICGIDAHARRVGIGDDAEHVGGARTIAVGIGDRL